MSYDGIVAPHGRSLGSVSFSTGAFTGASIFSGGTFSSVGSTFIVTSGGGHYGQPPKGTIFSGSFVGPISWTLVSQTGKFMYNFTLSGTIYGMLYTGRDVTGNTTQNITLYKNQWSQDHMGLIRLGNSHLNVPEPGTLGLLGTGLIAMAGSMRRKLFER
ncbi:MAG TPA: PEP-CTERM sorting domain-containing protein [Terriglobales bacterium]|nr:PEP-CTERM sorting domain-containing protein [Terriglobales bacterium]